MSTTVIIVGSAGQDGTLLRQRLAAQGHTVVGVTRRSHDLSRPEGVRALLDAATPAAVYYLAAEHGSSEGAASAADRVSIWERSWDVHVRGAVQFLEAIRQWHPSTRLFYAASGRVFGTPEQTLVDEQTPMRPQEVYGITKLAGVHACRHYRTAHGLFASCGLLFNHESPLRPAGYVSQRLARGAAEVKLGLRDRVRVAALDATVDWGAAQDYVAAMERVLALDGPDDFVIATGQGRSVRQFAQAAFGAVGLDWQRHVVEDASLGVVRRPPMVGDASHLRRRSGWRPVRDFDSLVREMVEAQLAALATPAGPAAPAQKEGSHSA